MSKTAKRLTLKDLRHPVNFLALGFGSGLAPKAPGTFGTLAAVPLYLMMTSLSNNQYLLLTALISLVGIWICGTSAEILGVHDHSGIVWDEIAGFLITMYLAPSGWLWIVLGFIYFRIFDILKPWPISWLDKHVGGGFGIMIDDIVAGLFAWLCLWITVKIIA